MQWRVFAFLVLRSKALRLSPLVLIAALGLALPAKAVAPRILHQQFTLQVHVDASNVVAAVEVRSTCCAVATRTVSGFAPSATFDLQPGDYVVAALPNSNGRLQGWHFASTSVHLDGDRTVLVRGSTQGTLYQGHDTAPDNLP